jgi:hypothetical protein
MIFVETPIFTAAANELLTDDDYSAFQQFLIKDDLTPTQKKLLRAIKDKW